MKIRPSLLALGLIGASLCATASSYTYHLHLLDGAKNKPVRPGTSFIFLGEPEQSVTVHAGSNITFKTKEAVFFKAPFLTFYEPGVEMTDCYNNPHQYHIVSKTGKIIRAVVHLDMASNHGPCF
jgi:hypothetical protein